MHLPDGFLSLPTAATCWAVSGFAARIAVVRCTKDWDDRLVPLLGITSAGIFAAQMVTFPIPGGTSGHLMGGLLSAILLGPWLGLLAMSCVLTVQCLMFADGGLLALGANILNLAVVGSLVGFSLWRLFLGWARTKTHTVIAAGIGAWIVTMLSAGLCSVELAVSGLVPLLPTMTVMLGVHALIGVGEALITMSVLSVIMDRRPELLPQTRPLAPRQQTGLLVVGLAALLVAPWASTWPDGLESAADSLGFSDRAWSLPSLFADYQWLGQSGAAVTLFVGLIGCLLAFLLAVIVGRLVRRQATHVG